MTKGEFQTMLDLIGQYVNSCTEEEDAAHDEWMKENMDEVDEQNILGLAELVRLRQKTVED